MITMQKVFGKSFLMMKSMGMLFLSEIRTYPKTLL
jgi:hypothetical protein